jgi:hypothetical protein
MAHPYHKHRESERKAGHARYKACGGRMAEGGKVGSTAGEGKSDDYWPVKNPAPVKSDDE